MLPHLRIGNVQPDLTLLVVGAWSLRRGVEEGVIWAFIGGIVLDLLSSGPAAASILALLGVSLVLGIDPTTGLGRRQMRPFGDNPLALILGVIFATLTFHMVLLMMLQLTGHSLNWLDSATRVILPRVPFNLVLIPFIYRLLGWVDRRTRREELIL